MSGCFVVYEYPLGAPAAHDIAFQLANGVAGEIPDDQKSLKSDVERSLDVLRAIYQPTDLKFRGYFDELLALSRYGLVGASAQPKQAAETLQTLQTRLYNKEKGNVISSHMGALLISQIIWLSTLMAAGLAWVGVTWWTNDAESALRILPVLTAIPGLLVGLVFSSFMRCRAVTFYDLRAIDADRFTPHMKTAFAIVILVLVAILLKAELFEIVIGKIRLSSFDKDWLSATVFGVVVGIAQEAVISRIESVRERVVPPRETSPRNA